MTLSSQITKVVYEPDGLATVFPVPFPVFDAGDVEVITVSGGQETILVSGFTVSGIAQGNVVVTFSTPPPAGSTLVIRRFTRHVQESDYPEAGRFPAKVLENDLDRVVAMIQELSEFVDRSIQVDVSQDNAPSAQEFLNEFNARVAQAQAAAAAAAQCRDESCGCAQDACVCADNAAASEQAAEEARDRAKQWADAAADAVTEGMPLATPGHNGMVPAGGQAGQFFGVSDDGQFYEFRNVLPAPMLPADVGKVLTATAGGPGWEAVEVPEPDLPALEQEMAGKLSTSAYAADAPTRVKAWGFIRADGTIAKSFGIVSSSRPSTGNYRITFSSPRADALYAVVFGGEWAVNNPSDRQVSMKYGGRTTTYFDVMISYNSAYPNVYNSDFSFIVMDT